MTGAEIESRLRSSLSQEPPLPGHGRSPERHRFLAELGREDLSLARLAEGHWDAVAILAEAGREAKPGELYAVWASEIPGHPLQLETKAGKLALSGSKMFCSGAGIVDHALVTVGSPEQALVEVDLREASRWVQFDDSSWKTHAFEEIKTSTAVFREVPVTTTQFVGASNWYVKRAGFWHGACGPAACWAGGAMGLVDWASSQHRSDAHTMAHLGAMQASVWALRSYLQLAGADIDEEPLDVDAARVRALTLRHLVEQECTNVLRRLTRAYGPYPLAANEQTSRRYQELDLYLRQSHAERDLESLGRDVSRSQMESSPA